MNDLWVALIPQELTVCFWPIRGQRVTIMYNNFKNCTCLFSQFNQMTVGAAVFHLAWYHLPWTWHRLFWISKKVSGRILINTNCIFKSKLYTASKVLYTARCFLKIVLIRPKSYDCSLEIVHTFLADVSSSLKLEHLGINFYPND